MKKSALAVIVFTSILATPGYAENSRESCQRYKQVLIDFKRHGVVGTNAKGQQYKVKGEKAKETLKYARWRVRQYC